MPFAGTAVGLLACLALFVSVKRELRREITRSRQQTAEILERLQAVEASSAAREEPLWTGASPPSSGLNLHKRVRVSRMLRRGEDTARIAAALSIPRSEVELLIRIQELAGQATP